MSIVIVGSFPYAPGFNPYQQLFTKALESAGIEVRRIPPSKWFPLSRACRQPVDLLHLDWHHDWYRGRSTYTRLLKSYMYDRGLQACQRLPVVWTAHNLTSHDTTNAQLDHDCTQALLNVCQGVMVMSDAAESLMRSQYAVPANTRVAKVPHGHYIDCYPNELTREEARAKLGIGSNEFVYVTPGAIRPYKGHLWLIDAFARVGQPADRLLIAGAAKDANYLAEVQSIANQVTQTHESLAIDIYPTTIGGNEWQIYFNAADVCVLPFRAILNSGSLLLAMSFGKPVVAPNIGSLPEVAHASSFVGFEANDENGLANAMRCVRETRKQLPSEQEIVEYTRREYDWQQIGARLKELYTEILR